MFNTSAVWADPSELLCTSQLCESAVHGLLRSGLTLAGYSSYLRERTVLDDAEVDCQALAGRKGLKQLG
jgi:hypothetical protein